MRTRRTGNRSQAGQAMVEYTIVLVFGVMVLTTGPGGDVIKALLDAYKKNYNGYTYGLSVSEIPDHDSLYDYLNDPKLPYKDKVDPAVLIAKLQTFGEFPTVPGFPTDMPHSVGDILVDIAGSILGI
jgi:hypothetical protein